MKIEIKLKKSQGLIKCHKTKSLWKKLKSWTLVKAQYAWITMPIPHNKFHLKVETQEINQVLKKVKNKKIY